MTPFSSQEAIQQRPGAWLMGSRAMSLEASRGAETGSDGAQSPAATLQRRIKLCFISPLGYGLYHPEAAVPFGGAELQCFLLSQELARDPGLDVIVLTNVESGPGSEAHGALTLVKRRARHRLARYPVLRPLTLVAGICGYLASFWDMYWVLRSIDADAYLHAGAGVEVGAYGLICRMLRRRFIYLVASSADIEEPYGKVAGTLRRLYPAGLRLADAIVCRTHDQQAGVQRQYGRDSTLIRTGHPTGTVLNRPRTTILWVGRMHPLKQPEKFLDLAERLPGESCVMVAMRDRLHEDLWGRIQRRASALPNVTLRHNVARHETDGLFAEAKLFVNTSTYEGFPNTFVEAAMHGMPIVSLIVNPDHVLTDKGIGRCAEGSFEQLVNDARALSTTDGTWSDYARRARAYAMQHHDIRRSALDLKSLVTSLVSPHIARSDPA